MERKPKKILIADDEPNLLEVLEMGLLENQYEIITAHDGKEALDKVYLEDPDLIIIDLKLPGLAGWEVCHILRYDKKHRNTPKIMMTGRTGMEDVARSMESGASAFLAKPFRFEALLGLVRGLLK